jgi:hypothetical protein
MSIKARVEKLESKGEGGKINFAMELQKLRDIHRQEEAGYRQMIADGAPVEDVQRLRGEREQARLIEKKTECERIIAGNGNHELVALVRKRLSLM